MENAMKHIHRTRGDCIFDAINVAALCLLLAVILYPLIYVLSCSFSDPLLVVQSKITFLPMQPTLVAYQRVFRNELIMTGYQNTLFYTLLGTVRPSTCCFPWPGPTCFPKNACRGGTSC